MKKILLVDDEENARNYLEALLSELYNDAKVYSKETPAEALELMQKINFDVVLLDVEMTGMTGLDMLQILRNNKQSLPVVFVSAYKRAEFIQKAIRLDAVDYIDKPVDPFELKHALDKIFSNILQHSTNTILLSTEQGELNVSHSEILYFEAFGRYAKLIFTNKQKPVVVRNNLKHLADIFGNTNFQRVSRQYIVNKNFVKFKSKSNHTITLFWDNQRICLSKIYPHIFVPE